MLDWIWRQWRPPIPVSQIATGVADAFLSATDSMIGEAKAKRSHRRTRSLATARLVLSQRLTAVQKQSPFARRHSGTEIAQPDMFIQGGNQ
jgi:hypothetical protein